jgi:hypothetical protein
MYTLQGKIRPTRHTLFTLSSRMVQWHPRRRAPDTIHSTTAIRSAGPYPASLPQPPKSSGEKSTPVDNRLLGLPGLYHQYAIGTFNTCSWGLTEQSLTDTGGGYNLGGADLPHTHSPTFPTSCPHFPLIAPPGLHFNQILAKDQSVEFLKNLWLSRGLSITQPSTIAYIYA